MASWSTETSPGVGKVDDGRLDLLEIGKAAQHARMRKSVQASFDNHEICVSNRQQ